MILALVFFLMQTAEPHVISHYSTDDGLSQSTVWSVVRDREGVAWIGTSEGLNQFFGNQFQQHKSVPNQDDTLIGNEIRTMLCDDDGVWVGTGMGLCKLDRFGRAVRRFNRQNGLNNEYVTALAATADGTLWVGTFSGLHVVMPTSDTAEPVMTADGEPFPRVRCLMVDSSDRLWIGTDRGFWLDETGNRQFRHFEAGVDGLVHNGIRDFLEDDTGLFWIATRAGLSTFNQQEGRFQTYSGHRIFQDLWINCMAKDRFGRIWFGTPNQGLLYLEPAYGQVVFLPRKDEQGYGLSDRDIISLTADEDDLLWVGTFSAGFHLVDLRAPLVDALPLRGHELNFFRAPSLVLSKTGHLWIGTEEGLLKTTRDGKVLQYSYHRFDDPSSLSENQILSLAEDVDGNLWIGTFSGGLNRKIGEDRYKRYSAADGSLSNDYVNVLFQDREDRLWVGTRAGAQIFNRETDRFETFALPNEVSSQKNVWSVNDILQSEDGQLWFGLYSRGLVRYNPETQRFSLFRRTLKDPSGLTDNRVYCLAEDGQGGLWVGTLAGLNHIDLNGNEVRPVFLGGSLDTAAFYAVYPENRENVWFITSAGIAHYNNEGKEPRIRLFSSQEENLSNDFYRGAVQPLDDGTFLVGGNKGINVVHSDRLALQTYTNRLTFTSLFLYNEPIDPSQTLTVPPGDNMLSFEFTVLDYRAPNRTQHAYMMEGLDDDWVLSGRRRYAEYANLPPGSYRFLAKGAGGNGIWNHEGISLEIVVKPPFYAAAWFHRLIFVLVLGLIILSHFTRVWVVRRRNQRLERLVAEKTKALEDTKEKRLQTAHFSGIFEIASGVLNQIAQVLHETRNSVKDLQQKVAGRGLADLEALNRKLSGDIGKDDSSFIRRLDQKIGIIDQELKEENRYLNHEVTSLNHNVEMMREIISVQHDYAKGSFYFEEVDPAKLIQDALILQHHRINQLGIRVNCRHQGEVMPRLARIKLMMILNHILDNAVEAVSDMHEDRRLIEVTSEPLGDDALIIQVSDRGPGIAEEDLASIFRMRWTQKTGHAGMGLHQVANTLKEMKGSYEVVSNQGGTKFKIFLPLDPLVQSGMFSQIERDIF